MKHHIYIRTLLTCSLLASADVFSAETCLIDAYEFEAKIIPEEQIHVNSDAAQIVSDQLATFVGNVKIETRDRTIETDSASIENNGQVIIADGKVDYLDPLLKVESSGLELNADLKLLQMASSEYKISSVNGRGNSDLLSISEERGVLLESVSFTTCPKGGEDWKINASEIKIGRDRPFGEAKHTVFYVAGIPVFYLPYFAFPITTERLSGLLFPEIGSSSSTGIEYTQPFYWNIAPNLDTTISLRYMTNRGIQFKNEWRYLTTHHAGELHLEYLPSDLDRSEDEERYFFRYTHQGSLSKNWSLLADINGISDDNYIVELGNDFYNQADTHLNQKLGLYYFDENLNVSMFVKDFTTLGSFNGNYRALPEIKLSYASQLTDWINFELDSELAYFDNESDLFADAARVHVAPSINIPYQRAWGELVAEATVMHTFYNQDLPDDNTELEETVSRTIGEARLFGSLFFERPNSGPRGKYMLTFEPKVQYLFTSFEDQSSIGLYDTTELLTTFGNLFRGQEFTGLDRINENNQFTFGATSRLIDQRNREILIASVGQIVHLEDPRLQDSFRTTNRSALAAEVDWQINQNWFLHADVQVSATTDKVDRSSFSTEYRLDENKLVQLNHRYIRDLSDEEINQFGISASWPIAKHWHWVGRWYRDLELNRTSESFVGLEYESCCWALRLTLQRRLATRFDNQGIRDLNQFDSSVALQFVFRGLSNNKRNRSKIDMLQQGLFGYRQPFLLN
ncbi:MAG: LPS assembly protein LptD [Pseudomonadota bacterium]